MNRLKELIIIISVVTLIGCSTTNQSLIDPAGEHIKSSKTADLRELNSEWFSKEGENNGIDNSKKFAEASFIYSITAFDAYEYHFKSKEHIPFPSPEIWTEAQPPKFDENTGFYAKSWIRLKANGEKELIVAYRGTEFSEWADWSRGNLFFTSFGFIDNQYEQSIVYAKECVDYLTNTGTEVTDIILVGHSLGGGLAQYAQRFVDGSRAVVFDPSPNKGRLYSFFYINSTNPSNSLRVYEDGEILQYLRWPLDPDYVYDKSPNGSGIKTRWIDTYAWKPFAQHDMQDLSTSLIKIAAAAGNDNALDIIKQLEARRLAEHLSDPYYELNCKSCPRKKLRTLKHSK
jgi:pimeloyl-ACP methyl ester carboxylesterase